MDYADIAAAFEPIWKKLDHYYLNQIPGLQNPSGECIAAWIWRRLKPKLPLLTEVVVAETCSARCVCRGMPTARERGRSEPLPPTRASRT